MSFAETMLDMLTSAYNRTDLQNIRAGRTPRTNIGKLLSLAGWGFDILKEQTEQVRLWDDIDRACGAVLDRHGKNYGVMRGAADDEMYRIMIKVKMLSMLTSGNLDTLIYSAASLFDVSAEDVRFEEVFPAKVYLYIDEDKLDEEHKNVAEIIARLMDRIKSAGIGLRIFYRTYSSKRSALYVGSFVDLAVFMDVSPELLNKKTVKCVELNAGIGTLVYVAASYPPLQNQEEYQKWQGQD